MTPGADSACGLSLLLIEDNPDEARLFEELLAEGELDVRFRWQSSVEAGLEAARDERPDIVAIDLGLPDSEGVETVRRVARAVPDTPLVVTTDLDDLDTATAALDAGASEYLRKDGLTPALLSRTLQKAVERHRLQREADRQRRLDRSILESLPEHIAVLDEEGTILATNKAWRAFAEREGGDPRGNVGDSYLEETREAAEKGTADARRMLDGLNAVLRGGRNSFKMKYSSHGTDEKRWFRISVMPVAAEGRSGVVVSHIDITERVARERELEQLTSALRERMRERACLSDITRLLHADDRDLRVRLKEVVERLPGGWQYPEVAEARVALEGDSWTSENFAESEGSLSAPVEMDDEEVGEVEVVYREERPDEDIGPFLEQERELLVEVANEVAVALDREQMHRELEAERERWASVVELAPTGIAISDVDTGEYETVNEAAAGLLGYGAEELEGTSALELEAGVDPERRTELIEVVRAQDGVRNRPLRLRRRDGEARHVRWSGRILERDGRELLFQTIQDITERQDAEQQRRLLATAVETMATGLLITGPELEPPGPTIRYVNSAMTEMTGYNREELIGETPRLLQGPDTDRAEGERLKRKLADGQTFEGETVNYRKDGTPYHLRWQVTPLRDEDGEISHFVSVQEDITDRKRTEEQLRYQALHDPLTGLANRTLLTDRVEQGLARSDRHDRALGLLMLDIDHFKRINDRLGHVAGDRVLTELADRIREAVREEDTVARWGGDEFAVALPDLQRPDDVANVRDRIYQVLRDPIEAGVEAVHLDVTMGAVLQSEGDYRHAVQADAPDELLRFGSLALHWAKEDAPRGFQVFDPEVEVAGIASMRRERALREGIDRGEVVPHFQPVVRLENGSLAYLEVLARWRHPEHGLVPPAQFIPLAEELGLIGWLERSLLRQTCRQVSDWQASAQDSSVLRFGVNLSAAQLGDGETGTHLYDIVVEEGIRPEQVTLEVTEDSLVRVPARIDELRELGFSVAVDDFGTGYSTFSYLRDLEVDELKIDLSFVQGIVESGSDAALAETMIDLGHRLGLDVVAEGVETEGQRERLRSMGCLLGQGFLFARPMPAEEVGAWLKEEV